MKVKENSNKNFIYIRDLFVTRNMYTTMLCSVALGQGVLQKLVFFKNSKTSLEGTSVGVSF